MPVCHVLYIGYNTPTNHDLAQVQISLDNNVERSFSILIHKSVENDMGSDLDMRFVSFYKSSLRKWMLNKYKSTAQNHAAPKVAIMVISIQLTYIYDTPMKLSQCHLCSLCEV